MSQQIFRTYLVLLLAFIVGWLVIRLDWLAAVGRLLDCLPLLQIIAVYLSSHGFRMLRLMLLTLDERNKILPLINAHMLTAFPSSFLSFKMGEVLRLGGFFHVYDGRQKALAVWLTERFSDVVVIMIFIVALRVFNVELPNSMQVVLVIFSLLTMLSLICMLAVSKASVYLNRQLVLSSHSARGLRILRVSHVLKRLEEDIHKSVEGRLAALFLLSLLVWIMEILAIVLFLYHFSTDKASLPELFASGLLANLPGGTSSDLLAMGAYQSLALVALALIVPVCRLFASIWPTEAK
jgi:hypothetical protein